MSALPVTTDWYNLKEWLEEWNEQLKKPNTLFINYYDTPKTIDSILKHMNDIEKSRED
jgi:hypothetical protein